MANEIRTNELKVGEIAYMKGKLNYARYLTKVCEGEDLAKYIQQQKAMGRKFPVTVEHCRWTLNSPEVIIQAADKVPSMLEKYLHNKIYKREDGTETYECIRKGKKLPAIGLRKGDKVARFKEEQVTGVSFANGQEVTVIFKVFDSGKGNFGVGIEGVIFEEEPKVFDPTTNIAGGNWVEDDELPTFATGNGESADGFVPVEEADVPDFTPAEAESDNPWA